MQHYKAKVTWSRRQAARVTLRRDGSAVRSLVGLGTMQRVETMEPCGSYCVRAGLRSMVATATMFRNARLGNDPQRVFDGVDRSEERAEEDCHQALSRHLFCLGEDMVSVGFGKVLGCVPQARIA